MRLVQKLLIVMVAMVAVAQNAMAADVTFNANVPLLVSEGEPFPVEFALNASPDDDTFVAPKFDKFNVIAGPRISTGTSIQIVNGDMTKTVNYTYTYVLISQETGNFTIPPASVKVKKAQYSTSPMPIEVVKEQTQKQQSPSAGSGSSQSNRQSQQERASNRIANDDLILKMTLSQRDVYKSEPLHATIKLYSRVDIVNTENLKLPTFNGFWAQDITDSRGGTSSRETYNGKVYQTHVVREYLLYPQQAGELTIEPAQIDIIAQVVVQSRNVDPFFGGGHEFYNVRRHLETPAETIDVKRLPSGAPASFSGAVGKFEIEMLPIKSTSIKANSAETLRIRVSGSGNMTFVQAPKLELPNSFELYNVRTTESISNTASGAVGYKEFEYPFIARSEGDYTIPAVEFSYFDSKTGAYNVVSTNPFSLAITPDNSTTESTTVQRSGNISKMDVAMLGSDIHFIKLGKARLRPKGDPLILSGLYFAILALIVAIYTTLFILLRKAMRDAKNIALRRGKQANKIAIQRFKLAKGYMDSENKQAFYEEMLRGVWGYMSDKLNIPVAELTKEYVREELSKRGCSAALIQSFGEIITKCDEAQYSPMSSSQMSEIYGAALYFVSQVESFVKRK